MIDLSPLSSQIERELRRGIVSGELQPGQKISIEELASYWHVSSTPVRDAIRRLEAVGFVKVAPRKSVYVANMNARAFKDVFDLRVALECLAVELALPNLTRRQIDEAIAAFEEAHALALQGGELAPLKGVDPLVHDLFLANSGNAKLVEIMDGLSDLIAWARNIIVRQPQSYETAYPEHMAILTAARSGDTAAAQAAMRQHLRNSCERTLLLWDQLTGAAE